MPLTPRNTCSDSIAKLFRACFHMGGGAKKGHRRDVRVKLGAKKRYWTILGER